MQHSDNTRQHASVAGRGLGAGLVTLLAAFGRQADDVPRFAGRHVDDLGRGAFQQADDLSRVTLHGGDDLLTGCGRCGQALGCVGDPDDRASKRRHIHARG